MISKLSGLYRHYNEKHPMLMMTLLMFVIIPVISSLALGYEMKADVAVTIPTVVMDNDRSDFSRDYLGYIENSPYFNIVKYADSYSEMRDMIYKGNAFAGVVIPEHFYQDMKDGKSPKILTIYDGSTMAVIVSSKASMMEILLTVKAGYMVKVFEGKQNVVPEQVMNQVNPLDVTTRTLFNPEKSFRNFILPGLLAAIVQVAIAITGAERGWENQQRNLSFTEHLRIVNRWSLIGFLSLFLTLGVQWFIFGMPYRGTILGGILLTWLFSCSITMMGYLLGTFFEERTFCTQISCILVLPTAILGGYTWPVLAMPPVMQLLAKVIPFTYYGNAIRNLCLKPMEIRHLSPDFTAIFCFLVLEIIAFSLVRIYRIKKASNTEVAAA